jgi:hypothetical protein
MGHLRGADAGATAAGIGPDWASATKLHPSRFVHVLNYL